jgi:hypothetical protein
MAVHSGQTLWLEQTYPERVNTCAVDEFLGTIPPMVESNQCKIRHQHTAIHFFRVRLWSGLSLKLKLEILYGTFLSGSRRLF